MTFFRRNRGYDGGLVPKLALLLGVTALSSMGFLYYWNFQHSRPSANSTGHERRSRADDGQEFLHPIQGAEQYLERLAKTQMRSAREELITEMRRHKNELSSPILLILGDRKHPNLLAAVRAAGILKLQGARPFLLRLAREGPANVRLAALDSAGGASLDATVLKDVLTDANPALLAQGLKFFDSRSELLGPFLVDLLLDEDPLVRKAALRRFPVDLSLASITKLIDEVRRPRSRADACTIIRALTWVPPRLRIDRLFWHSLRSEDASVRVAAMCGLARRGKLRDPEPVWRLLEAESSKRPERVQALLTLEATSSVSIARIKKILPSLDAFERYFAARCLISRGDRAGRDQLMELLALSREVRNDPKTRWDLLRPLIRRLLTELSGTSRQDQWEDWALGAFYPKLPLARPRFSVWQL